MGDLVAWLNVTERDLQQVGAKQRTRVACRRWFIPKKNAAGAFCTRACYERKSPRSEPPEPDASDGFTRSMGRGGRIARFNAAKDLDQQLGLQDRCGPAICLHCFGRFTPDREGEEFCTDRCREQGPSWAPETRTLVVEGVAYEATSAGRMAVPRPDDLPGGSSLRNLDVGASRGRRV